MVYKKRNGLYTIEMTRGEDMRNFSGRAAIKRALNAKGRASSMINTLLNIDADVLYSLSESNMRQVIKKLRPEVKRRIKEFGNDPSPAVGKFLRSGGGFSPDKQDLNSLRSEFMRMKMFLDAKTSTASGWEDSVDKTIKAMNELGVQFTRSNFKDVWRAYSILAELDESVTSRELKYLVLKQIIELQGENRSAYEIATEVYEQLKDLYREHKIAQDEGDFYAEYFGNDELL